MKIYPAIDLKGGNCVRLFKGDMAKAKIFNQNPASQALEFQNLGFKNLHLVDLDGAIQGHPINKQAVMEIVRNVNIPIQLGGGIRNLTQIENWLEIGISQVILGTIALKNPEIVKEACQRFPGKIIVGIDAVNGFVATEGWVEASKIKVLDLAKKFEDSGVSKIIYTDISRDGTLSGINFEEYAKLAENLSIPITASGGVSSIEDVKNLSKITQNDRKKGVEGVIIGMALYEKRIKIEDLAEFLG